VSDLQRRQMTTFNGNIQVIAIDGKFDDCQRLVKQAFMDPGLSGLNLSSANSINIGRLIPQSVYYFYAWSRLAGIISEKIIFSVPCGNFGNAAGGIIARKMGLPVSRFVISTNENDEVPSYLRTGVYKPVIPSKNCISSAMNVGHPSNLARIIELYGGKMDEKGNILKLPELEMMRKDLFAVSISDVETKKGIRSFYDLYGKILEPHGAVAWIGLQEYLKVSTDSDYSAAVSLETAHPAKFREEIKSIIDKEPDLPDSLLKIEAGTEEYISLENYYETLKNFIIKNH
jgi:threonine synthase